MRLGWSWVLISAATGLVISGLFSGLLHLSRDVVVLGYVVLGGGLIALFFARLPRSQRAGYDTPLMAWGAGGIDPGRVPGLVRCPGARVTATLGLAPGAGAGLVGFDLRRARCAAAHGRARSGGDRRKRPSRTAGWKRRVTALGASLLVTAVYHLGFREFQGPSLKQPLIGNGVITAAYLITGNLFTPVIGHVIMHGAAVFHGIESTPQLPPHSPHSVR